MKINTESHPTYYYKVADLTFSIESDILDKGSFSNYSPFRIENNRNTTPLFHVQFKKILKKIKTPACLFHSDKGVFEIFIEEGNYLVIFRFINSSKQYKMCAKQRWKQIEIDIDFRDQEEDYMFLNDFIMFAFIYSSAYHHTVLLHASCVKYNKYGIAFIGPSGIGKSTLSSLWLKYIKGSFLLNDDQPAVRLINGKLHIYGTPWSGKTSCFKNDNAELVAVFNLEQAANNEAKRLTPIRAFQYLLSSSSMMREDKDTFKLIADTLSLIAQNVNVFHLRSAPYKDAANLSFEFSIKSNQLIPNPINK